MVVEASCLVYGKLDDLLCARSQPDFTRRGTLSSPDDELNGRAHFVQFDAEVREHSGSDAIRLSDKTQKDVLRPDVVVVESLRFFLSQRQHPARSLCKLLESACHRTSPVRSSV